MLGAGLLMAAGGGLWSPAQISTALWLDAADSSTITQSNGFVSQWNDKSGNNRNATQATQASKPSYSQTSFDGLPGVSFNSKQLIHTLTSASQYTIIVLYKTDSALSSGYAGIIAVGVSSSGGSALFARLSSGYMGAFSNQNINSGTLYSYPQKLIAVAEDDNSNGLKSFWVNGTQSGTYTGNPSGQSVAHIGGITGQGAPVTIAEIIVTVSVASTDTRQTIEGYLAHKWSMSSSLPAGHPYKSAPPYL